MIGRVRSVFDALAAPVATTGLAIAAWRSWQMYAATDVGSAADERRPDLSSWPRLPKVSVLVAAWNESEHIIGLIDSFERLSYPELEMVICAGGQDGTYEMANARSSDRLRVLPQVAGAGKQGALRECYTVATGDVVVLTDADCRFVDMALLRLLEPIVRGEAEVTTGFSEPPAQQRGRSLVEYQWLVDRWVQSQMPRESDGLLGRNCAITRRALDRVGAFDPEVRTGTDYYLAHMLLEAGYRIRSVPDSRVISDFPVAPRAYVRMYERWHKNLLIHGPRFGAWDDVRIVLTAFVAYGLAVALPFSAPIFGRLAFSMSGALLGTALLQRLARAYAGARLARIAASPRLVATATLAMALDFVAVFLAVYATVDPRRRGRW